jgi:4-amino-4-deoxychorismate lyase
MSARLFIGEERIENNIDAVLAEGRGIAYGDGVFETMRAVDGSIPWWPAHRARLALGTTRLRIALPSPEGIERELRDWLSLHRDAAIKLIVTRGSGGRGYAMAADAPPVWALIAGPLPAPSRPGGLVLRWCDARLSRQPLLAGIKHCNRLEQILARSEWSDTDIDEGLLRDIEGDVIAATAANLFVLREGRWWTPPVDHCGIAGVCRSWALQALAADERRLGMAEVESADAVVLCNAVRGILPVARLGDRVWSPHPAVDDALRRLAAVHPAFADPAYDIASNEDAP